MKLFLRKHRKRIVLALAGLLVLLLGPYILSRLRSAGRQICIYETATTEPTVAVAPDTPIRVLAYNIAHGRGSSDDNWAESGAAKSDRIDRIAALLKKEEADLVVLNEVDFCSTWSGHQNQAEALARAAGYPYWVEQRNLDFRFLYGSVKSGNAVLSRYPIVDATRIPFPALSPVERLLAGSKQGLICTVKRSPQQHVRLVAVHLEHRSETIRVASAQRISVIVAGDFNSTLPQMAGYQQAEDGRNAVRVLQASETLTLPKVDRAATAAMTYPTDQPTQVIDWILAPRLWQFAKYRVLNVRLSDHRPVVADLVPRQPSP